MTPQTITKSNDGSFQLATARFDTLNEAIEFAEVNDIPLTLNELTFGYRLGGMIVTLSEAGLDEKKIVEALADSTDFTWTDAAEKMIDVIRAFTLAVNRG